MAESLSNRYPTYGLFARELLRGLVDELDSLSLVEVASKLPSSGLAEVDAFARKLELIDDDRVRRMLILEEGLKNGYEFEGHIFGIPIIIKRDNESGQTSGGPEPGGVREPRRPIKPSGRSSGIPPMDPDSGGWGI